MELLFLKYNLKIFFHKSRKRRRNLLTKNLPSTSLYTIDTSAERNESNTNKS